MSIVIYCGGVADFDLSQIDIVRHRSSIEVDQ